MCACGHVGSVAGNEDALKDDTNHIPTPVKWDKDAGPSCTRCNEKWSKGHQHNCRLCGKFFCSSCTGKFNLADKFKVKKTRFGLKQGACRVCFKCRDACIAMKEQRLGRQFERASAASCNPKELKNARNHPDQSREILHLTDIVEVPAWEEDKRTCKDCHKPFVEGHVHNCRLCGRMSCSSDTVKLWVPQRFKLKGKRGPVRVCVKCHQTCIKNWRKAVLTSDVRLAKMPDSDEEVNRLFEQFLERQLLDDASMSAMRRLTKKQKWDYLRNEARRSEMIHLGKETKTIAQWQEYLSSGPGQVTPDELASLKHILESVNVVWLEEFAGEKGYSASVSLGESKSLDSAPSPPSGGAGEDDSKTALGALIRLCATTELARSTRILAWECLSKFTRTSYGYEATLRKKGALDVISSGIVDPDSPVVRSIALELLSVFLTGFLGEDARVQSVEAVANLSVSGDLETVPFAPVVAVLQTSPSAEDILSALLFVRALVCPPSPNEGEDTWLSLRERLALHSKLKDARIFTAFNRVQAWIDVIRAGEDSGSGGGEHGAEDGSQMGFIMDIMQWYKMTEEELQLASSKNALDLNVAEPKDVFQVLEMDAFKDGYTAEFTELLRYMLAIPNSPWFKRQVWSYLPSLMKDAVLEFQPPEYRSEDDPETKADDRGSERKSKNKKKKKQKTDKSAAAAKPSLHRLKGRMARAEIVAHMHMAHDTLQAAIQHKADNVHQMLDSQLNKLREENTELLAQINRLTSPEDGYGSREDLVARVKALETAAQNHQAITDKQQQTIQQLTAQVQELQRQLQAARGDGGAPPSGDAPSSSASSSGNEAALRAEIAQLKQDLAAARDGAAPQPAVGGGLALGGGMPLGAAPASGALPLGGASAGAALPLGGAAAGGAPPLSLGGGAGAPASGGMPLGGATGGGMPLGGAAGGGMPLGGASGAPPLALGGGPATDASAALPLGGASGAPPLSLGGGGGALAPPSGGATLAPPSGGGLLAPPSGGTLMPPSGALMPPGLAPPGGGPAPAPDIEPPYKRKLPDLGDVKLDKIFWDKLSLQNYEGTLFEKHKLRDVDIKIDHQEVVKLFERKAAAPKSAPSGGEKKEKKESSLVNLIPDKRSFNVNLKLGGLHMTAQQLYDAILRMDSQALAGGKVNTVANMMPTAEEVQTCVGFVTEGGSMDQLPAVEKMFATVGKIPEVEARMQAWIFMNHSDDLLSELDMRLSLCERSVKTVAENEHFHRILELMLTLGNILNSQDKRSGNAYAFKPLSTLKRFADKKCTQDSSKTALTFLIQTAKTHYPEVLEFVTDFQDFAEARKIEPEILASELSGIQKRLRDLKKVMDVYRKAKENGKDLPGDRFLEVMQPFYSKVEKDIQKLVDRKAALDESVDALAPLYGERVGRYKMHEYFEKLDEFAQSWVREDRRMQEAQRRAERKNANPIRGIPRGSRMRGPGPAGPQPADDSDFQKEMINRLKNVRNMRRTRGGTMRRQRD